MREAFYTHARAHAHTHMHALTQGHTQTHTQTHRHRQSHKHTRTHTLALTYTHPLKNTHTLSSHAHTINLCYRHKTPENRQVTTHFDTNAIAICPFRHGAMEAWLEAGAKWLTLTGIRRLYVRTHANGLDNVSVPPGGEWTSCHAPAPVHGCSA